jgi:hypothetical protein
LLSAAAVKSLGFVDPKELEVPPSTTATPVLVVLQSLRRD